MPTFETAQFGPFDGLDNRKTVYDLFVRMGHGLGDEEGNAARAGFLQGLIVGSTKGWAQAPMTVTPCNARQAYHLFIAITGCLDVPVEDAAKLLERVVAAL